jgi:hypothetical protein
MIKRHDVKPEKVKSKFEEYIPVMFLSFKIITEKETEKNGSAKNPNQIF